MYISFVASPLMKYVFFASLDEINGIFISKFEYPLYIVTGPKLRIFSYTSILTHGVGAQMNRLAAL